MVISIQTEKKLFSSCCISNVTRRRTFAHRISKSKANMVVVTNATNIEWKCHFWGIIECESFQTFSYISKLTHTHTHRGEKSIIYYRNSLFSGEKVSETNQFKPWNIFLSQMHSYSVCHRRISTFGIFWLNKGIFRIVLLRWGPCALEYIEPKSWNAREKTPS